MLALASSLYAGGDWPSPEEPLDPKIAPTKHGPVYVVGSDEYRSRVAKMKITPERARVLADEFAAQRTSKSRADAGWHLVIVGDHYLFSSWWDKDHYPLVGYFVNGLTGTVVYRTALWKASYRQYPKLANAVKRKIEDERVAARAGRSVGSPESAITAGKQ